MASKESTNINLNASAIGTSLFKNLKLNHDTPIFDNKVINYTPSHPITHIVVNNNHLVIALSNNVISKIDLDRQDKVPEEIDLSKYVVKAKILDLFLDPLGYHLLVSVVSIDNTTPVDLLYIPWKTSKVKISVKLKSNLVTALGWNFKNKSDSTTGQILVGTSKGLIFELEINSDEKLLQSSFERTLKKVMDLSKEGVSYIYDLNIVASPTNNLFYLIFCSSINKLFCFTGYAKSYEDKYIYSSVFSKDNSLNSFDFIEHCYDNMNHKSSFLQLCYPSNENIPKCFVWVAGNVLYSKDIDWLDTTSVLKNVDELKISEQSDSCCGIICSKYHALIAWKESVQAICLANNQTVFEETVKNSSILGICKDKFKGTLWVYSPKVIYKYSAVREDRNMWLIYLEKGDYETAKTFCKKDEIFLSHVLIKEAENIFLTKNYEKSATLYAMSPASFEEVCLKFLDVKAEDALKIYLSEKLKVINADQSVQLTLIVLWLMELHIRKLGVLRDEGKRKSEEYHTLDAKFKEFLKTSKVKGIIHQNSNAVYSILSSNDDHDNYIAVALIMKDFHRVIQHLISQHRYIEALEVMCTQNSEQLFYQHIPTLLRIKPKESIEALISQGKTLNPIVLLPSLVHGYSSYGLAQEVLSYIKFCVDELEVKEKLIHNFLITLYCDISAEKLLSYLKLQGEDVDCINYDVKFALRECTTAGHDKACIHLMNIMGLYEKAVNLALKTDVSLAKSIANKVKYNTDLCKKLWLEISEHVIHKEKDVSKALEILKECDLIRVEDILPFFPDFVTIDEFKDTICDSLQNYNVEIENLKFEMEEATRTAESIRAEIKEFKQNCYIVKAQDKCSECGYQLKTQSFYLFPCSHRFHQSCLMDSITNFLPEEKQKEVQSLKGELIALSSSQENVKGVGSIYWNEKEKLKYKIDSIVSSECLYCSEIFVNAVDKPFISNHKWEIEINQWL